MVSSNNLIPNAKLYQTGIKLHHDKNVNKDQIIILQTWISACHYTYNLYLKSQYPLYERYLKNYPNYNERKELPNKIKQQYFLSGYEFTNIYNHTIKNSKYENFSWFSGAPSHTIREPFSRAADAFKNYFKGMHGQPKFKGRNAKRSLYFDNVKIYKNKIKLEKIGKVQLQHYGRLPTTKKLAKNGYHVTGCWVHEKAGYWYVTVRTNEPQQRQYLPKLNDFVLGIDLGIKTFATFNHMQPIANITKSKYYLHLEHHMKRCQASMSRKCIPKQPGKRRIVTMNYRKAHLRYQRAWKRIRGFMDNWIQQCTSKIIKTKPKAIVFEDLNIKGMKSNHKVAPALQKIPLFKFKQLLIWKAKKAGIEIRQVSRWMPSTKVCSKCGLRNNTQFNNSMKDLEVRQFLCPHCGFTCDRDLNAAINLSKAHHYEILTNREMDTNPNVVITI